MKHFLFVLLLLLCKSISIYAQVLNELQCLKELIESPETIEHLQNCNPDLDRVKNVRFNFHFLNPSDGSAVMNETSNNLVSATGVSDDYWTIYKYSQSIIEYANRNYSWNAIMNTYCPPNPPINLPKNIRAVLNKVFVHNNDELHQNTNINNINFDNEEIINVFFSDFETPVGTGGTTPTGWVSTTNPCSVGSNMHIHLANSLEVFSNLYVTESYNHIWNLENTGNVLNHEFLHLMSLHHTLLEPLGPFDPDANDFCNDTPNQNEILDCWDYDNISDLPDIEAPACPWSWNQFLCSNNTMDYNLCQCALSPCQLDRVHNSLANCAERFTVCHELEETDELEVDSFTLETSSYIAKKIVIGRNATPVLNDYEKIDIYFQDIVAFYPMEVTDADFSEDIVGISHTLHFEVFQHRACPCN